VKRYVIPIALLVLLVASGYLAVRALAARNELEQARPQVEKVKTAVLDGDTVRARAALAELQRHAHKARRYASGPLWRLAGHLPLVGDDVDGVHGVTVAIDQVATDVLPPLVDVAASVKPSALRVAGNRINTAPLATAEPALHGAAARSDEIRATLSALHPAGMIGPVRRAVTDVRRQVDDLAATTDKAATAAKLLPPMLGAGGKRTYLLAFQNNAEARGTGGLLGAYGVLDVDKGRLSIRHLGPNTELRNEQRLPIELGADYFDLYGNDPALWVNSNESPHFPYGAQIWLELYRRQFGQRLDGVIATDPVAMGYLLSATGPARLATGEQVTSQNAVALTLRDVYARFPNDNTRRDLFLQLIAKAVFDKLLSGQGDPVRIVDELSHSADERRLLVYSTRPGEESELGSTALGGVVHEGPGAYVGLVINNAAGSKMDYYLSRALVYEQGACTIPGRRESTVRVTLINTAPKSGLPPYVTIRADERVVKGFEKAPLGSNASYVQVYATAGAELLGATVDGKPLQVIPGRERGKAVFTYRAVLQAGQTQEAVLRLDEPRVSGPVAVLRQPLVRPITVKADASRC
jgi:hypothetical protein